MNKRKIFSILLVALLCTAHMLQAQTGPRSQFITDSLDTYIQRAMQAWNIPGVSVAIVRDGKPIVLKGYGVTQLNGDQPVDEHTLFMVASNVKAFTGTAMAMLEHDKRCSLDDKVQQWLPKFTLSNPDLAARANLRDLLVHNLGYSTFQGDFMYFYSDLKPGEIYTTYARIQPPFEYRSRYGYSNIGYFYAGECISAISGMSWDAYISKMILKPLEMHSTRLLSADLLSAPNLATGHTFESGVMTPFPPVNIDLIGAAAGMSSTANDLANWLIAQTDGGRFNDRQVIPQRVIDQTRKPYTIIGRNGHYFNRTHYELYGLGWSMEDYEGSEVISHSGGIWGYVTGVSFVPELDLGIVALTNTDENWFYEALKWEIIDACMGLPFRGYSDVYLELYKKRAETRQTQVTGWQGMISDRYPFGVKGRSLEGTWHNEVYGNITIREEGAGLRVSFLRHPGLTALLQPLTDDTFLCTYTPSRFGIHKLKVTKGKKGEIDTIEFQVADRLDRMVYPFTK
jgi:CubicO group peptidase (beta-lactamase class C family)